MDGLADDPFDADGVVNHDHGRGPQVRAERADGGIVQHRIESLVVRHNKRGGRSRRHDGFDRPIVYDPAALSVDQVAEGFAEGQFVVARLLDAPGEREDFDARAVGGPHRLVPVRAVGEDERDVGERLDVVDDGRLAVQTERGRERRADARLAALAFERFHQRGLFAADVRARAEVGVNVKRIVCAEEFVAEETGLLHFGDLLVEEARHPPELAAQINVDRVRADRVGGNRHALQKLEGILLHDLAVLERARLGLVRVGDNVMRPILVIHERPLHAGGETRAAASAQTRSLDHVGHIFGLHRSHSFFPGFESAVLFVNINLVDIGNIAVTKDDVCHYFTSFPLFFKASINSTVLSTVIFS